MSIGLIILLSLLVILAVIVLIFVLFIIFTPKNIFERRGKQVRKARKQVHKNLR